MKNKKTLTPINPSSPVKFWNMDSVAFEEMCCALFQQEQGIESADLYGTPGQLQEGIDILAERKAGGYDVAQCKCYETFSESDIDKAVKKFLNYVSRWKKQDTKRFFLLVACSLSNTKKKKKIAYYDNLLRKEHNIHFKAWSGRILQNKLRPHRGIVLQYLGKSPEIVEIICGPQQTPPSGTNVPPIGVFQCIDIPPAIREKLNHAALKDLDEIISLYTKGVTRTALSKLIAFKQDTEQWDFLNNETKAKFLRFESQLRFHVENNIIVSKQLADEADALHSSIGSSLLRALLLYEEHGVQAALDFLGEASEPKILQLRVSLLIAIDDFEQVNLLMESLPAEGKDAGESLRLKAHVRLREGKIESAIRLINQALDIAKDCYLFRYTKGVLLYYSSLSPVAVPKWIMSIPEPVDWMLVRRDDQSSNRLSEAAIIFESILNECELNQIQRRDIEGWMLACLACNTETISAAEEFCQRLLKKDRTHHHALGWGLTRGLTTQKIFAKSIEPLQHLIEDDPTPDLALDAVGGLA